MACGGAQEVGNGTDAGVADAASPSQPDAGGVTRFRPEPENSCTSNELKLVAATLDVIARRNAPTTAAIVLNLPFFSGQESLTAGNSEARAASHPLLFALTQQTVGLCAPSEDDLALVLQPTAISLSHEVDRPGAGIYGPLVIGDEAVVVWIYDYEGGGIRFVKTADDGWMFAEHLFRWIS